MGDALAAAGLHPSAAAPELTIPEQVTEHPSGPHCLANGCFSPQRLETSCGTTVNFQPQRKAVRHGQADTTQRDINPSLVTFSCLHRT